MAHCAPGPVSAWWSSFSWLLAPSSGTGAPSSVATAATIRPVSPGSVVPCQLCHMKEGTGGTIWVLSFSAKGKQGRW